MTTCRGLLQDLLTPPDNLWSYSCTRSPRTRIGCPCCKSESLSARKYKSVARLCSKLLGHNGHERRKLGSSVQGVGVMSSPILFCLLSQSLATRHPAEAAPTASASKAPFFILVRLRKLRQHAHTLFPLLLLLRLGSVVSSPRAFLLKFPADR